MKNRHSLFVVLAALLIGGIHAEETKPLPEAPRFAYGLMLQQGEKLIFSPCRDRSYSLVEDISPDRSVTRALNAIGLNAGKKLYVELVAVLEGGVLKASEVNMAQQEGRCQLPGTKDEVWRAAGNEPGWVLAVGGEQLVLKRAGQPEVSVPYAPFQREGRLALFSGGSGGASLSVRLENTFCHDTLSHAVFSWSATLGSHGEILKGCAWAR